jgi:hypothetical protein
MAQVCKTTEADCEGAVVFIVGVGVRRLTQSSLWLDGIGVTRWQIIFVPLFPSHPSKGSTQGKVLPKKLKSIHFCF